MQPRTAVTSCIVLLLALGILTAPLSRAGIVDGLVAYYPFDSSSPGTTPDLSGNGNPLNLEGSAAIVSGGMFPGAPFRSGTTLGAAATVRLGRAALLH